MRWSWRAGRIAGIDISIHATFLLLLVWVAVVAYQTGRTAGAVISGVVFILVVFGTIVLHELGHALMAQRFGIHTQGITLLPIGGLSQLERIPRDPRQELLIAITGPLINVALAAVLFVGLWLSGGVPSLTAQSGENLPLFGRVFVAQFMFVNVWIAIFNLIPAFPMDGGRVLRAALVVRYRDYARATVAAARAGRFLALLFGVLGLFVFGNPFLVLIALFIWLSASGEAATEQVTELLRGVTIPSVMVTDVHTLAPTDSLGQAVQLLLGGFQQDFPVMEQGHVVGVLPRSVLLKALTDHGEQETVGSVMERSFPAVAPQDPIASALDKLRGSKDRIVLVLQDRRLLGVLTLEHVSEVVAAHAAQHKLAMGSV